MILNPRSRLVRWAYFFDDYTTWNSTTLFRFFWRAFVFLSLSWWCIFALCCMVVFSAGMLLFTYPKALFAGLLIIIATFAGLWYLIHHRHRLIPKRIHESVFAQGLVALKRKLCPIIYFEEGSTNKD